MIAQAQSGTGKTATFAISILQQLDVDIKDTQALVLAPTRELAQQIQKVVIALGDYMSITCHACIGGTVVREDMAKLSKGQQVVVGTPGRVFDMIKRRALSKYRAANLTRIRETSLAAIPVNIYLRIKSDSCNVR